MFSLYSDLDRKYSGPLPGLKTLKLSPDKEVAKEEKCLNCHEVVSLDHQCGGCTEAFINEDDLTAHKNNEHPFMCIICFNFFKDKDSKRKHTREKHPIPKL